jgi:hypothetical protein
MNFFFLGLGYVDFCFLDFLFFGKIGFPTDLFLFVNRKILAKKKNCLKTQMRVKAHIREK